MTTRRTLDELLTDPGFTPGKRHYAALIEGALAEDEALARRAAEALARAQDDLGVPLERRFDAATPAEQPRLVRLAGRLAQSSIHTRLTDLLERALSSDDARVRRAAGSAIGRARVAGGEAPLLQALEREADQSVRRHLIDALGKIGGKRSIQALSREVENAADEASAFEATRATARASRTVLRATPSLVRSDLEVGPQLFTFLCRAGLEEVIADEIASLGEVRRGGVFGPGRVDLWFRGRLQALFRARTALRFGSGIL